MIMDLKWSIVEVLHMYSPLALESKKKNDF